MDVWITFPLSSALFHCRFSALFCPFCTLSSTLRIFTGVMGDDIMEYPVHTAPLRGVWLFFKVLPLLEA